MPLETSIKATTETSAKANSTVTASWSVVMVDSSRVTEVVRNKTLVLTVVIMNMVYRSHLVQQLNLNPKIGIIMNV